MIQRYKQRNVAGEKRGGEKLVRNVLRGLGRMRKGERQFY